ncbi:MAG: hypothetical protein SGPRY_008177, partial [Prymnesium sp.]
MSSPRLWWRRLIAAVLDELKRVRPVTDWRVLKSRKGEQLRYIQLYSRRLRAERGGYKPEKEDRAGLLALEKALPLQMILFYRQLAEQHERVEAAKVARAQQLNCQARARLSLPCLTEYECEELPIPKMGNSSEDGVLGLRNWIGNCTPWGTPPVQEAPIQISEQWEVSEEQHIAMAKLMGTESEAASSTLRVEVSLSLKELTVTLREASSSHSLSTTPQLRPPSASPLWLQAELHGFSLHMHVEGADTQVGLTLQQLRVCDHSDNAAFPLVLTPHSQPPLSPASAEEQQPMLILDASKCPHSRAEGESTGRFTRSWRVDVKLAPISALGEMPAATVDIGSYVEASLRSPEVDWHVDLTQQIEGTALDEEIPFPDQDYIIYRTAKLGRTLLRSRLYWMWSDVTDYQAPFAVQPLKITVAAASTFTASFSEVRLVVPESKDRADCLAFEVVLNQLALNGSVPSTGLDSLSANLRLPGLLVLEPVVAPLRDVSGTLASLVVPSAGFVNSKLVLSLAIPELTLCFSPRGFGAMMKFGANPDPTQ